MSLMFNEISKAMNEHYGIAESTETRGNNDINDGVNVIIDDVFISDLVTRFV